MAVQDRRDQHYDILSLDFKSVLFALRFHRALLLICALGAVALTSVYVAFVRTDSYRSEAILKMSATAPSSAVSSLLASLNGQEPTAAKLESLADLLGSTEFNEEIIAMAMRNRKFLMEFAFSHGIKPKFTNHQGSRSLAADDGAVSDLDPSSAEELGRVLGESIQFVTDPRANTLTVQGHAENPWLSADLADVAADAVVSLNYKRKSGQIKSLSRFLTKQLDDTSERMKNFEAQMSEYQRRHGVVVSENNGVTTRGFTKYTKILELLEDARRQLAANNDRIRSREKDMQDFRSHLKDPNFFKANVYLTQLQNRMRSLSYELDLAHSNETNGESSGPNNAQETERIKSELQSLGQEYSSAVTKSQQGERIPVMGPTEYFQTLEHDLRDLKRDRDLLVAQQKRLTTELESNQSAADLMPEQMRAVNNLRRNITLTSQIFLETERKLQEVSFMEAETVNDLSVLYRAKTPDQPSNIPMLRLFFMMAIVGLAIASAIIIKLEIFGQTIRSKRDLEKSCPRVLGTVPLIPPPGENAELNFRDARPTLKFIKDTLVSVTKFKRTLVLESDPDGEDADNFRQLRMHLMKMIKSDDELNVQKSKIIMVTSPRPQSGRTFMAANLALSLAKADHKTLLVDLDLRNPSLYAFFPRMTPSSATAFDSHALTKSVQKYSSYLDVLLVEGQATHPPEILESNFLQEYFESAREKYEFIIFDTPAVLTSVDSSISSALADLVVMTAESSQTKHDEFNAAVKMIRSCVDRPIYGVLNFSDRRRDAAA